MNQNQLQNAIASLQNLLVNHPMDPADERVVSWAVYYLQLVQGSGVIESYNEVK